MNNSHSVQTGNITYYAFKTFETENVLVPSDPGQCKCKYEKIYLAQLCHCNRDVQLLEG